MKKNKLIYRILVVCFAGLLIFLTFNRHSKSGYFNYHSEIWADKAGYYVYLPAAFKFDFKASNFPKSIDSLTGDGFKLDYASDKIQTKVTYGVALLQLPFFLLADYFAPKLNMKSNGFSPIYHWSINVASIFYLLLGMILLKLYLKTKFRNGTIYLVLFSIFLGTNLFYYSIDETGMSHVYSFSLFCIYLYFLQKSDYLIENNFAKMIAFGFLSGLIILIRPTNIIFLSVYFFLDLNKGTEIIDRFKRLIQWRTILPLSIGAFVVLLPQLVYWYYLHGTPFYYSYENEGFNWANPKFLETWFSPNNGLFLYSPFYLVIIGSILFLVWKGIKNGVLFLTLFLFLSYVLSSWWSWNFGCSFGGRSYVEYLAIFSLPIAYSFEKINGLKWFKSVGLWTIVIALIIFNLKVTYTFDECFYGKNEWDWGEYIKLITDPTK